VSKGSWRRWCQKVELPGTGAGLLGGCPYAFLLISAGQVFQDIAGETSLERNGGRTRQPGVGKKFVQTKGQPVFRTAPDDLGKSAQFSLKFHGPGKDADKDPPPARNKEKDLLLIGAEKAGPPNGRRIGRNMSFPVSRMEISLFSRIRGGG